MLSWIIIISTETHGKLFNIIEGLYGGVHEATNPVIEATPV